MRTLKQSLSRVMLLIGMLLATNTFVAAQTITVKGTVVDNAGEPMIGASVVQAGTTNGVLTDLNGNFTLANVPANASIQVSYVGYVTQSIALNGRTTLNVTLTENAELLEEVVVVGYGVQKKSDVTGAIASVSAEKLTTRPVDNAFQALQGKVAGVDVSSAQRPGEVGGITIRGVRSINASNTPLYVVDGVPLQGGGIETINPRDIETIDILKDASSTAIYGFRAANGVVLVTTKRGKQGRMQLNYAGSVTIESIHDMQPAMKAADYITWRRWAMYNSNPTKYTPGDEPTMEQDKDYFGKDKVALNNVLKGWASGTWDPSKVEDYDWTGLVSQTGVSQEHTISASGGTDAIRAFMSMGYLHNQGTQKGQDYERYNAAMSVDITAKPWFSFGGSINTSWGIQDYGFSRTGQAISSGPSEIYGAAKQIMRYALPYDENGNIVIQPTGESQIYTVMDEWKKSSDHRQSFRALGSFYATVDFGKIIEPLKGLTFKTNFGPDFRFRRSGIFIDSSSAARQGSKNYASWSYSRGFSWVLDNQFSYDKSIGKHHFTITAVQSASRNNDESASMSAQGIPVASFKWNNMGSVDFSDTSAQAKMGTGYGNTQIASYLGRLNYSYNDRYLLTVSGRYDGSSVLAAGHKWAFFPSMALGWRMEQEDFIKEIEWIDQLKLRLGWGDIGNASVGRYGTLGNIQSFYVPFGGKPNVLSYATNEPYASANSVGMANKNLTWERTRQTNIGVDFSTLRNRLSGTVDVYFTNTTDLIFNMPIPTITGFPNIMTNIGETKNFGVELTINAIPVKTRDFMWDTSFNAAIQKDEVVSLINGKQDMIDARLFIGYPLSVLYGVENAGLWQDTPEDHAEMDKFNANGHTFQPGMVRPVDQDDNYKIDAEDNVIIGRTRPLWTAGWSNTLNYKGLELTVEMSGRLGYKVNAGAQGQEGSFQQVEIDYWTPKNTGAYYQKPIFSTAGGDQYSGLLGNRDASFVKIRTLSLGYVIPKKLCGTLGISSMKVYAQAKNPGMLYSSIDFMDLDLYSSIYNRGVIFGLQIGF